MIRYTDISLVIPCSANSAATVSNTLGVQPSRLQELPVHVRRKDGSWRDKMLYVWVLDSPKPQAGGDPVRRLAALAAFIEPFASRLPCIHSTLKPMIMVLHHITPAGKIGQLRVPAGLRQRYGAWKLDIVQRVALD